MSKRKDRKDTHHRRPLANNGADEPWNTSEVEVRKHRAWHLLFGTMSAEEIANEINRTWLDPQWRFHPMPVFPSTLERKHQLRIFPEDDGC